MGVKNILLIGKTGGNNNKQLNLLHFKTSVKALYQNRDKKSYHKIRNISEANIQDLTKATIHHIAKRVYDWIIIKTRKLKQNVFLEVRGQTILQIFLILLSRTNIFIGNRHNIVV